MNDDLKYWVWLSSLVKLSARKRYQLLKHYSEPYRIWQAGGRELEALPFLKGRAAGGAIELLLDRKLRSNAEKLLEAIHEKGIGIITFNGGNYPECLRNIYDPPVLLYVRGKIAPEEVCVSVVGSRKATFYGLDMSEKLSYELAGAGVTVVSGMARGVDTQAHRGALKGGGRTIAVLGCGLDRPYPLENSGLMEEISRKGAAISEYLPGVPPVPLNFPARNRIISGISMGVVIIEAGEKSGSLITADYALDQGREVFAVPGNINSGNSKGTNRLIRDGAKIVTDVGDILDEIGLSRTGCGKLNVKFAAPESVFGSEENSVAKRLAEGPVHIDTLARDCGLSIQLTASILVMLELNGFVEQLPGKYYKLALQA